MKEDEDMSKKNKNEKKKLESIYDIDEWKDYRNPVDGRVYCVDEFALRFEDEEELIIIKDLKLGTKYVVTLEYFETFEKVKEDE